MKSTGIVEPPVSFRARGVGEVGLPVHVPAAGAEEPVAFERGGVAALVLLAQKSRVARHVGSRSPRRETSRRWRGRRRSGWACPCPRDCRSGRAPGPSRRHRPRSRPRRREILAVEQLIVPLRRRKLVGGIDVPVGQRNDGLDRKALGLVGHAKIGDAVAEVRMVLGDRPDDRRAPIVADPDRLLGPERAQELDHVGDDLFERIILVARIDARASVAAHVGRNRAKPEGRERRKLLAPGDRQAPASRAGRRSASRSRRRTKERRSCAARSWRHAPG